MRDPFWQCLAVSVAENRIWPDSRVGGVEGQRSNSTCSIMSTNEVMGWGSSVLQEGAAGLVRGGRWAVWKEAE